MTYPAIPDGRAPHHADVTAAIRAMRGQIAETGRRGVVTPLAGTARAYYHHATAVTFGSSYTPLPYSVAEKTCAEVTVDGTNSQFTLLKAGIWAIKSWAHFNAWSANTYLTVRQNGTPVDWGPAMLNRTATGSENFLTVTSDPEVAVGDVIDVALAASSTGISSVNAQGITHRLSLVWLRP